MNSNTKFSAPFYEPPKISSGASDILLEGADGDISKLKNISLVKNLPVNVSNGDGENLIHIVIKNKNNNNKSQYQIINFIKYLVDNNTNPDQPNKNNKTPLHFSCLNQYNKITEYLLKIGCNPNFKDNLGMTPFHYLLVGKFKEYKFKEPDVIKNYSEDVNIIKNKNISEIKKILFNYIINKDTLKNYTTCLKNTLNNVSLSRENVIEIKNIKDYIDERNKIISDDKSENKINLLKTLRAKIETNITNKINLNFTFPDIEVKENDNILNDNNLPSGRDINELIAISNIDVNRKISEEYQKIISETSEYIKDFEKKINQEFSRYRDETHRFPTISFTDNQVRDNTAGLVIDVANNVLTNIGRAFLYPGMTPFRPPIAVGGPHINELSYSLRTNILVGYNPVDYSLNNLDDLNIRDYNFQIPGPLGPEPFNEITFEDSLEDTYTQNKDFLYLKNALNKANNSSSPDFRFNSYKLQFFTNANIEKVFNKINPKQIFYILVFVILCPKKRIFNIVFNKKPDSTSFNASKMTFNLDDNTIWDKTIWDSMELHNICKKINNHFNKNYDERNNSTDKFILLLNKIDEYRNNFVSKCNNNLYIDIIYLLKYFHQLDYDNLNTYPAGYQTLEDYCKKFLSLIYDYKNPNNNDQWDDPTSPQFKPEYKLPKYKFWYVTRGQAGGLSNNPLYDATPNDQAGTNLINIAYILDMDCLGKIDTTDNCLYPSGSHIKEKIRTFLTDDIDYIEEDDKKLFGLINKNFKELNDFYNDVYHSPEEYLNLGKELLVQFMSNINNFQYIWNASSWDGMVFPQLDDIFNNIVNSFNEINALKFLEKYFNDENNISDFYYNKLPLYNIELEPIKLKDRLLHTSVGSNLSGKLGNNYSNYDDDLGVKFNFEQIRNDYDFTQTKELPPSLQDTFGINLFLRFILKKILGQADFPDLNEKVEKIINSDSKLKNLNFEVSKWYFIAKSLEEILVNYTKSNIQTNINNILVKYFDVKLDPNEQNNIDSNFFPIVDDNEFTSKLDNKINIDLSILSNDDKEMINYFNFNKIKKVEDLFIVYPDDYSNLQIEKSFLQLNINSELVQKMLEYGGNLDIVDGNNRLPFDNLIDNHYYLLFQNSDFNISDEYKFNINSKFDHGYLQYTIDSYKNHINRYIFNETDNSKILELFVENQYNDIKLLISTSDFGYNVNKYNKVSFTIINYLTNQYLTQHSLRKKLDFTDFNIEQFDVDNSKYDLSEIPHHINLFSLYSENIKDKLEFELAKIENNINKYKDENNDNHNKDKIKKLNDEKTLLEKEIEKISTSKENKNYKYDLKLFKSYDIYSNNKYVIQTQAWFDLFDTKNLNDSKYLRLINLLKEENKLEFKSIGDIIKIKNIIPFYDFLQKNSKRYFEGSKYFKSNKVNLFLKEMLIYCTKIIICPQIELFVKRLLLDHYRSINTLESDLDNISLIESLLNQSGLSNESPIQKLYNLSEVIIKNALNRYDNKEEKMSFNNQSMKEIIEQWLNNLTVSVYINISEDSKIYETLTEKVGNYFDSFVFKMIENWTIVFENNLKFTINQYRILKVFDNLIK